MLRRVVRHSSHHRKSPMPSSKEYTRLAELKRQLAAKYTSLANQCKGAAKRRSLLFRAERYTHQAEVFARKAQAQ
jgi:hypothetical protein